LNHLFINPPVKELNVYQWIWTAVILLVFQQSSAQTDAEAFKMIAPFVPKNYSIHHYSTGDANGDGRYDFAVILRNKKEDSLRGLKPSRLISRPVLLIFRNKKSQLYLHRRLDSLLLINDPWLPIPLHGSMVSLQKGKLNLNCSGGFHLNATVTTQYSWDSLQRNFYLHSYSYVIHQPHGDITIPRNQLTIPQEELLYTFRIDQNYREKLLKEYCDSKYVIGSEQAYFHNYPDPDNKRSPSAVQAPKGSVIRCYTELKNYIWCTIEINRGYSVTGFIKRSDLSLNTGH
jgi:hypothetical protein